MRTFVLSALLVFSAPLWAAGPIDLENGRSPDGRLSARVRPAENPGETPSLEVVNLATEVIAGTLLLGVYGFGPSVAEKTSTAVLWSPDSGHLAVMTRGTKRSTGVKLFRVTDSGLTEIPLPSPTTKAFELLKATESYRVVSNKPGKWSDKDTLIIRASGGVIDPAGGKFPIWYEVDVTYDIREKKITDSRIVETKPYQN